MKHRQFFAAVITFTLLVHAIFAATPADPKIAKASAKSATLASEKPETALKPTMSAEQVLKIMGKPEAIKPKMLENHQAEIWIYVRETVDNVMRQQIGGTPIMIEVRQGDGTVKQMTVGETPLFGNMQYITEERIELLIFNGQYLTQKSSFRKIKRLN